jgi:hypothetical protein
MALKVVPTESVRTTDDMASYQVAVRRARLLRAVSDDSTLPGIRCWGGDTVSGFEAGAAA